MVKYFRMSFTNQIIVIVGPTASGKSDIANLYASTNNAEVVSADSMQIYRGMDIGTGKIMPFEQKVKHWGIDILDPNEAYSAALYQQYARDCFEKIWTNKKNIVLCGGTGFYIRAAIDDYQFPKGEQKNNPIRDKYKEYLDINGSKALWELLREKDYLSSKLIHQNNTVRVIRALELLHEGKSYASQANNLKNIKQKYNAIFFGLRVNPDILNKRINIRVDKMIEKGLLEEVENLLDKGYKQALTAASAIGYKEIVNYFENKCTLEEAVDQIKTASRQYAKRQRTWFNKDKRINWIDYDDVNPKRAVEQIKKLTFK